MQSSRKLNYAEDRIKEYDLDPETEFRFEIDWPDKITIQLLEGTAEIFGTELSTSATYCFQEGAMLAIFTWHGCKLRVTGQCKVEYVARETPMQSALNLHLALENKRRIADQTGMEGPRIIIVGHEDSGKTSLAKILLSYALKMERRPLFVDLDPSEGSIVAPTTLGAVVIDRMDAEESTGINLLTTPPLLYYYGHSSPAANPKAYKRIVSRVAKLSQQRCDEDEKVRTSGYIIDTHGWVEGVSMDALTHTLDEFQADIVIVIGHERLYSEVENKLRETHPGTTILKLPKSGGVVDKDKNYRRQWQMRRIREYFYGSGQVDLTPYTTSISFNDVQVRRIGETVKAPDSALPIGGERRVDEAQLLKIDCGPALLHTVLALSNVELPFGATENDEQVLPDHNLAGFVYVSDVDEKKKRLIMLAPKPGRLPRRYLWMGTLRWAEV